MCKLTFEEAVERLSAFKSRGWRLGLDRMQEFLQRLDVEDKLGQPGGPQFIHVAGTNGKGSTVAFLQSLLVEQGFKTGAMYSPYVYDVRERVQIGRQLIPKEDFARLTERLLAVGEELEETEFGGPTEFEMKTALGFLYWAEQEVEWVALETGLGGRLDATNVVTPAVSIITSIGLDHVHILGETLSEIAQEKAGIIKKAKPVVTGYLHPDALDAVERKAKDTGSTIWRYGKEINNKNGVITTPNGEYMGLEPGLKGEVQELNLTLAVAALDLAGAIKNKENLTAGAKETTLPGRYETVHCLDRKFILDGAHNGDSASSLYATLLEQEGRKKYKMITGRTIGHEVKPFYDVLKPVIEKAYVTKLDFHRTMEPREIIEQAEFIEANEFQNAVAALEACLNESQKGETILVTGSFYIVGEIGNEINRRA